MELRPSDVWIITPPKSGTTWVTHMAHQLRVRGRPVDFQDQDDVVPWIEMLDTGVLNGTAFNRDPNKEHDAWPRVFKSHLSWDALPQGHFKKVFVFREPADMLVSSARFLPSLWGIMDPPSVPQLVSYFLWNGDVRTTLQDLVAAWRARHRSDLLLLFYEDILEDHERAVRQLARFMGVEADDALISLVVNQTSHATMSAQHSAFANRAQARNFYGAQGLPLDQRGLIGKVRRDGGAAGGGTALPPAFAGAFRRAWEAHVAGHLGFAGLAAMRAAHAQEVAEPARPGGLLVRLRVGRHQPRSLERPAGPQRLAPGARAHASWRPLLQGHYDAAVRLALALLEALWLELGLGDEEALAQLCEDGDTISLMRMFNYLPRGHQPRLSPERLRLGSSPHTDWYLLTLIVRDAASRLQVAGAGPGASWHDVPAEEGEVLVLVGDYLSLHSQGRLRSPVHRVLLPESGASNSFVFLFSPAYDAPMLGPVGHGPSLPKGVKRVNTLLDAANKTPTMSFGDYIQRKRRGVMRT